MTLLKVEGQYRSGPGTPQYMYVLHVRLYLKRCWARETCKICICSDILGVFTYGSQFSHHGFGNSVITGIKALCTTCHGVDHAKKAVNGNTH